MTRKTRCWFCSAASILSYCNISKRLLSRKGRKEGGGEGEERHLQTQEEVGATRGRGVWMEGAWLKIARRGGGGAR